MWLLLLTSIVIWSLGRAYSDLSIIELVYHNYPICILTAFAGTFVVWELSTCLSKCKFLIIRYLSSLLAWIGRNTMVVLCVHTLFRFIPIMTPFNRINEVFALCMQIILCCIAVWACERTKLTRYIFCIKKWVATCSLLYQWSGNYVEGRNKHNKGLGHTDDALDAPVQWRTCRCSHTIVIHRGCSYRIIDSKSV